MNQTFQGVPVSIGLDTQSITKAAVILALAALLVIVIAKRMKRA